MIEEGCEVNLRSSSQQPPSYVSNAMGSSRKSNPSRCICNVRAGHVASTDLVNVITARCISLRRVWFLSGLSKIVFLGYKAYANYSIMRAVERKSEELEDHSNLTKP